MPKERHKLYDKAVDTLLTSWDANKELSNHEILEYLELDDLRRLMERLAYWIHSRGGTGDNEGGTMIDRDELISQLTQYIREMKKVERYCAKAEAERFLDRIIGDRAGLLSKQGRDRYAFVHKTFQEYLTTQEIRDRQEEDFEVVLEHIRDHLHNPHWREVLLLLIAQQKRSNPAKILKEILNHPTPYDQWLHRNLLFAGACLAENIEVTDATLVQQILKELVELEASQSQVIPGIIRYQVFKILCSLSETCYETLALQQLEAYAKAISKFQLCQYKAALGRTKEAVQQLILLLEDKDSDVRLDAAQALGKLGQASESVVTALLSLLKDEDSDVCFSAAQALGKLGQTSKSVVTALLSLLKDKDSDVCFSAAQALGKLGQTSKSVVTALLSLLEDKDFKLRSGAAGALGQLGQASESVVAALLSLLKDEDSRVRSDAAWALGKLGQASESVVTALLSLLKDKDSKVRLGAAQALGRLGQASESVVTTLLSLLKDKNSNVRSGTAWTLGELGQASESVVTALLSLLKDEDSNVRSGAAGALGQLGQASESVVAALLSLLKDEDSRVRFGAAWGLGKLGRASNSIAPDPTTIALVEWIEQNQESEFVSYGITALWNILSEETR